MTRRKWKTSPDDVSILCAIGKEFIVRAAESGLLSVIGGNAEKSN
jgi:hypothetical protein